MEGVGEKRRAILEGRRGELEIEKIFDEGRRVTKRDGEGRRAIGEGEKKKIN